MKIKLMMLVSLIALGLAMNANAGSVVDDDNDLVPNAFDNCLTDPNGPANGSNQVDADQDGFGNACDADYNQLNGVTVVDFGIFVNCLTPGDVNAPLCDHNGLNGVTVVDFQTFLRLLGPPSLTGPSGLACAGVTQPCTP
jgi:hypothetical protein